MCKASSLDLNSEQESCLTMKHTSCTTLHLEVLMRDVPWQVHTNIVVFKLKHKSSTAVFGFVKALKEQGVLVLPFRSALLSLCVAYRCIVA
jgi:hypothetical protein